MTANLLDDVGLWVDQRGDGPDVLLIAGPRRHHRSAGAPSPRPVRPRLLTSPNAHGIGVSRPSDHKLNIAVMADDATTMLNHRGTSTPPALRRSDIRACKSWRPRRAEAVHSNADRDGSSLGREAVIPPAGAQPAAGTVRKRRRTRRRSASSIAGSMRSRIRPILEGFRAGPTRAVPALSRPFP